MLDTDTITPPPIKTASETETDEIIVKQIRAGKLDKYELIMRRYNQRLFRIARSILRNDEEAKDVIQETYINCFTQLHQFKGPSGFAAWLARIATNQALMRLRKMKNITALTDETSELESYADEMIDINPEFALANNQLRGLIETCLEALPEVFRVVFILRAVEQLSTRETAEILEIQTETVKTRYHRAKQQLQKRLNTHLENAGMTIYEFAGERCDSVVNTVMGRLKNATTDFSMSSS